MTCPGCWFREAITFIWSASSHKHPGQHDVQQEVGAAQQLCRETKQKHRPETAGPPAQDEGISTFKLLQNEKCEENKKKPKKLRANVGIKVQIHARLLPVL